MEPLILASTILSCALVQHALWKSPAARYFADSPDHRKVHQGIVPRFGGIGIIVTFLAVLGLLTLVDLPTLMVPTGPFLAALVFTSCFLLLAGGWDDVRPMGFKMKFLLQFVLASGVVLLLGRDFNTIALIGHRFELGWLGPLLSIFWIVAVMNALNIIDGIDGLAGGVALCGFGAITFMAHANGAQAQVLLCMAIMGSILGFLRFNFSRSHKVFLGDAGSQFLGAMLALFTIEVQGMFRTGFSIFVPLFIVGYPLLDVGVAMVRRFKCGHRSRMGGRFVRMFTADNEHLHHRLVYLGLSHAQSTFLLLLIASGIGATAIIITRLEWPYKPMVMGYLAVAILLILNRLGYMGKGPWLTFPRSKAHPSRIVGVIEPDEVFMHSLNSFKQEKFAFLPIPGKLSQFMTDDLVAVLIYNVTSGNFDEEWTRALRVTEVRDCPAVVIAEAPDIAKMKAKNPEGYLSVRFIEKPVRIPDLMRMIEDVTLPPAKAKQGRERFSMAELALWSRKNAPG